MIWHSKKSFVFVVFELHIQHQVILRGKIASWLFSSPTSEHNRTHLELFWGNSFFSCSYKYFSSKFPFSEGSFQFTSSLSFRAQLRQSLEDFCTLKNWQIWDTNRDASECRFAVALRQRYVETALSYCDWWCHEPENRGWPAKDMRSLRKLME